MILERPFSVGDKVYFKTWEEMVQEYGTSSMGSIRVPYAFTSTMEETIDKDQEYIITGLSREVEDRDSMIVELSPKVPWNICLGMLKHADEYEKSIIIPDKIKKYIYEHYEGITNSVTLSLKLWAFTQGKRKFIIGGVANKTEANIIITNEDNFSKIEASGSQYELTDKTMAFITDTGKIIFVTSNLKTFISAKDAILEFLQKEIDPDNEFWPWLKGEAELTDEQVERLNEQADKLEAEIQEEKFNAFFDSFGKIIKNNSGEDEKVALKGFIIDKENMLGALNKLNKKIYDLKKEIFYLEHDIKSVDLTEFITALKGNKENILFFEISEGSKEVNLVVRQPLLFFEDEEWEICGSNLLEECRTDYDEKTAAIMDAIFTRKAQLTFEQGFCFTCKSPGYNIISDYEAIYKDRYKYGIPNPHMREYDCWGDNKAKITNFLDEKKYDLAYTQIISAIAGINITDGAVMDKFMEYLNSSVYNNSYCITDMETGEVMTLKEAKDYYGGKANEED